jgi:two-component system, cell cycle response regulator DivK
MTAVEAKQEVAMSKILCVEDSDDSLFVLHRRLSRAGFDVKVAANGAESVEWAKTMLPDLIVMDLNLPGINGWEATRRLKAQPETKHIPIIVLTADTSKKSREDAFAAGCDDFAIKPIDFPGLIRKIQALLAKSPNP